MNVSFCVTCYDGDVHLLHDRLISIYDEQTVTPDEVLVITSGVSSGPIVWDSSRPNLTIKTFEKRMLPGGARNQGGRLAKGDVVCFCDVDDPIHPQKCEIVKRVFDNRNVDALVHNYNLGQSVFCKYGPRGPRYQYYGEEFIMVSDLDQIPIEKVITTSPPPSTNVEAPSKSPVTHGHMSARKELLADISYREDMSLGEDGDFCQSIVKSNKFDLYYTPLVLINYIT
jgi:glycosyltransferase involved in cell wall biosynthesis